jgi:DNA-binding transcriptional LysR family regulator
MLTLRQIEVIRAIMLAGTVKGAADLLGVSAPGISRVMKHTESQLGIRLFSRRHGRFAPTTEAHGIFSQINEVFAKVENLHFSIDALKRGGASVFSFASAPSISQHILPRAVKRLRLHFPELRMNINILKIEETIDYLLLKKGELVAMSYKIDHPGLISHLLAAGKLVAVVPKAHPLAQNREISLADLARFPLIGIDPIDPYGQILAAPFAENGLTYELAIQARFAQTVCSLVAADLGVAVLDEFSMAARDIPGVVVRPIVEPTSFKTYGVVNAEVARSIFADELIDLLRVEMREAVAARQRGI